MFRTSYVHLQEDYIVHANLCGMLFIHLCKLFSRLRDMLDIEYIFQLTQILAQMNEKHHIRLHVQYSLPEDEH